MRNRRRQKNYEIPFLTLAATILSVSIAANALLGGFTFFKTYTDFQDLNQRIEEAKGELNYYIETEKNLKRDFESLELDIRQAKADINQTSDGLENLKSTFDAAVSDLENSLAALEAQIEPSYEDSEENVSDASERSIEDYLETNTTGWVFYGNRNRNTKVFRYLEYKIPVESKNKPEFYGVYPHENDILQPNMDHGDSSAGRTLRTTPNSDGEVIQNLTSEDLLRVIRSRKNIQGNVDYIWVQVVLLQVKL